MKNVNLKAVALILMCAIRVSAYGQSRSQTPDVVGTWHLVHIDLAEATGKPSDSPQPVGLLIYTSDRHASVQLMYPQASLTNEFVRDGYEATFGTYELDAKKHLLTYHVQASATREKLVGRDELLRYEFPDRQHMIIRPTQADQHWSVIWQRY